MSQPSSNLIFVIDDDEDVRYSTKLMLERAGYRVRDFSDAESFLAADEGGAAKCLLVDMNLPGITGMELVERLHARGVRIPTIVLSGSAHYDPELAAASVFHVLGKPTPAEELLNWVGNACERGAGSF